MSSRVGAGGALSALFLAFFFLAGDVFPFPLGEFSVDSLPSPPLLVVVVAPPPVTLGWVSMMVDNNACT